jgi:hypothetical protein
MIRFAFLLVLLIFLDERSGHMIPLVNCFSEVAVSRSVYGFAMSRFLVALSSCTFFSLN